MSLLTGLKSKPAQVKSRIAVIGALLCTGIIGVVWTSTLPVRFAELGKGLEAGVEGTASAKDALTDLVAEIETTPQSESEGSSGDTSMESYFETSALERLAEERFDPTLATRTVSEEREVPPVEKEENVVTPLATPTTTVSSTPPPPSSPRVILIGTTTKPAP